jgi:hypothetical protein
MKLCNASEKLTANKNTGRENGRRMILGNVMKLYRATQSSENAY